MSSHVWFLSQIQEQTTLVGLTSLRTNMPPLLPKLNRQRARFVLTKIDEA